MKKIISVVFVFLITCTIQISKTNADWAYAFVVYNGNGYVITETHIEPKQIGKKIGEVTNYSTLEGVYSGNFSNHFPKGTEYYEIKSVATKEAIAIKENKSSYIKAKFNGKYAGSGETDHKNYIMKKLFVYFIVGVVLLFGILYLINKKRNKK